MHTLLEYLERELPPINDYIERQVADLDSLVAPAAGHVLRAGGKRFRPLLVVLCHRALGGRDDIYALACSLEFLHSATLLHDDILDGAALRRGQKAAHLIFSRTETVLAGDVLLALANQLVADHGDPRLTSCLSEAVMRTAIGEVAEINNLREQDIRPERYLEIITGKTAYLIEAACRIGAIAADAPLELQDAAARMGRNLGIAFQIVDDAMDYTSSSDVSGKPAGGDLREGKLTLPLLYLLAAKGDAERARLLAAIREKNLGDAEVDTVLAEVESAGHATRARQEAADYVRRAAEALERFPAGAEKDVLADAMHFVLTREK